MAEKFSADTDDVPEMVERVARAMHGHKHEWAEFNDEQRQPWYNQARVAILEMRVPTVEMWEGAKPYMDSESSNAAWWQAMIDGALK